jgi:hypothetical protein
MKIRMIVQHAFVMAASTICVIGLGLTQARAETPISPQAAFERLKGLAGEWRGTSDEKDKGPAVTVTYKVTSNGSVVMETLFPGTEHEMITMYYLVGPRLVLTHYCSQANQPMMALTKASNADELIFDFAGGSNVKPKTDLHMHTVRIMFQGKDAITSEWDSYQAGKKADTKKFFLNRKG